MTPKNHDDLTSDLGRALHDRADGLTGAPITLSDVKGRATRIRRRRAIAASAAAAAAVAIIVPTAIVGSDMFETSTDNGPAFTPSPNPTETTGDAQSWPQRLDTSGLPMGEAPSVPWLEGSTLHTPDGDVTLPGGYFNVVPYDDGWIGLQYADDGAVAVRLDSGGNVVDESPSTDRIALSSDGEQVLWVDDGALTIHDNGTREDTVIGGGHEATEPIAIEDGVAYYNVDAGTFPKDGRQWDGEEQDPVPGAPVPYTNVSTDGITTELSEITDFGSCSTVRGAAGDPLVETCDFTLDEFAPDGAHLLAGPAYKDGFGDGEIAVLPADGAAVEGGLVVFHYQRRGDADPFFMDSVWEDDEHILVRTFTPNPGSAKGTWQILRIGLDGTIENAVTPVEANDLNVPFTLS